MSRRRSLPHESFIVVLLSFTLLIVSQFTAVFCRKSDYKRIIFTNDTLDFFEESFQQSLQEHNNDSLAKYKQLWRDYGQAKLVRLQPEKKVGQSRTIHIEGNRKKTLQLTTLSKRRPLMFMIDDFLFDDECELIKNQAIDAGLETSITSGEIKPFQQKEGDIPEQFFDCYNWEWEDIDHNLDGTADLLEMQNTFRQLAGAKFGTLTVAGIMKDSFMDFNADGKIFQWEWEACNKTKLGILLYNIWTGYPSTKIRHSEQQWLEQTASSDETLKSIQDRLWKVTGLPRPLILHGEQLQVVKYTPGGHYDCHLDSDYRFMGQDILPCCHYELHDNDTFIPQECASCRFLTALFYLDDTEEGGETAFPAAGLDPYQHDLVDDTGGSDEEWCDLSAHCKQSKLIVKPKKGRAVLWYNHFIDPDTHWMGAIDKNSLHGGCAVHKGVKWIANNWINVGFHKKHDFLSFARRWYHLQQDKHDQEAFEKW